MVLDVLLLLLGLGTLLRLGIVLSNSATGLQLQATKQLYIDDLVSILVPVRNEEHQIEALIQQLKVQTDVRCELILYDDDSTDETYARGKAAIGADERFSIMRGDALPDGWLGKNHACHQLSLRAKGKYFLFIDADVVLENGVISAAVHRLKARQCSLLSVFPKQVMLSWGERLVVPFMQHLLLTWLPLRSIYGCKSSRFVATNGQFMLFDAAAYRTNTWHEKLKSELVEDVAIMRKLKNQGERGMTLLAAAGAVRCRMYAGFDASIDGFSKNIVKGFGSVQAVLLFCFYSFWLWIPLLFSFPVETFMLFLCLLVSRIVASRAAGESAIVNVCLHLLQQFVWQYMLLHALRQYLRKQLKWKDRIVS